MHWLTRQYWYYRLKDSPYRCLFQPTGWFRATSLCRPASLFSSVARREYVSLDCETTSLNPQQAELVTIAATKIIGNRILTSQSFTVQLKAPRTLDVHSVKVHQIRHQDLTHGITELAALEQLIDYIGTRPLVGYHIRYDKTILDLACKRHLGFPLPNPLIEVSQLYQERLEQQLPNAYFDLSLHAICRHLDLPLTNRHDALQDAISAALVFVRLTHGEFPQFTSPGISTRRNL